MRLRAGGLTAIDGLGAERIRGYIKQTAAGYMQTTSRKCADIGKQGGRDGLSQAEDVQLRGDGD